MSTRLPINFTPPTTMNLGSSEPPSLNTPTRGLHRENLRALARRHGPRRIGRKLKVVAEEAKKKPLEPVKSSSEKRALEFGKTIHRFASGSNAKARLFLRKTLWWPQRKNQGCLAAETRAAKAEDAMIERHILQTAAARTMERIGR